MTPEQIRQFILQRFAAGDSLLTIRDALAAQGGFSPISAAGLVRDELTGAYPNETFSFAGLFPGGEGDPGGLGSADVTARPTLRPGLAGLTGATDPNAALEEASLTRGGRQNIFESFLGAQPGFNALNPLLQTAAAKSFNPLSAQFALQAALPGIGGAQGNQNFRSFLGDAPQRFNREQFAGALAPVGAAFSAANPSFEQNTLLDAFSNEGLQNNLMATVMGLGISPFLRRFAPSAVQRGRSQSFESDPTANPFAQFLNDLVFQQ